MAKMMGPRFKQCRRLGLNVIGHPKAMIRATKGTARSDKKLSSYGIQLLEKQRLRAYYGVMEKQFKRYYKRALKTDGQTGEVLINYLERRLDNIVYRLGFAPSIRQARQMVVHGHMMVNHKKVDVPSYTVNIGDHIGLRQKSQSIDGYKESFLQTTESLFPYLQKNIIDYSGMLIRYPEREEIPIEINDVLVVEFYSNL